MQANDLNKNYFQISIVHVFKISFQFLELIVESGHTPKVKEGFGWSGLACLSHSPRLHFWHQTRNLISLMNLAVTISATNTLYLQEWGSN